MKGFRKGSRPDLPGCRRYFVAEPKYVRQRKRDEQQRLQGKRQFVRRLRAELKALRKKNTDAGQADREEALTDQGFEAALDAVGDFLDARRKKR